MPLPVEQLAPPSRRDGALGNARRTNSRRPDPAANACVERGGRPAGCTRPSAPSPASAPRVSTKLFRRSGGRGGAGTEPGRRGSRPLCAPGRGRHLGHGPGPLPLAAGPEAPRRAAVRSHPRSFWRGWSRSDQGLPGAPRGLRDALASAGRTSSWSPPATPPAVRRLHPLTSAGQSQEELPRHPGGRRLRRADGRPGGAGPDGRGGDGRGRPVVASRIGGLPFTVVGRRHRPAVRAGRPGGPGEQDRDPARRPRPRERMGVAGRGGSRSSSPGRSSSSATTGRCWRPGCRATAPGEPAAGKEGAAVRRRVSGRFLWIDPPPLRRVALIYDDAGPARDHGGYCLRALGGLAGVEHPARPLDLVPRPPGLRPVPGRRRRPGLPGAAGLRPSRLVGPSTSTRLRAGAVPGPPREADLAFAAQRDGAARLVPRGWRRRLAALACDPGRPPRHEGGQRAGRRLRRQPLARPPRRGNRAGSSSMPASFVGRTTSRRWPEVYSAARLVFNRSGGNDVNMRVFEALACGSLLLTERAGRQRAWPNCSGTATHLATYGERRRTARQGGLLPRPGRRPRAESRPPGGGRPSPSTPIGTGWNGARRRAMCPAARWGGRRDGPGPAPRAVAAPGRAPPRAAGGAGPLLFGFDRPEIVALVPAPRGGSWTSAAARPAGRGDRAPAGGGGRGRRAGHERRPRGRGPTGERSWCGDVEGPALWFGGDLDAVVCGDVLEHLGDPGGFLRRAPGWLPPGGQLVASLPNVRQQARRRPDGGELDLRVGRPVDETHLGFFTRRHAGRSPNAAMPSKGSGSSSALATMAGPRWLSGLVRVGPLLLAGLTRPRPRSSTPISSS